jgi:transcriptional regulator with XRE-family HTH domain
MTDSWDTHVVTPGASVRGQRKLANLSLRELAEMTKLPNPYLSQTERGLHQPSVRVLKLISGALGVPGETLLAQEGPSGGSSPGAQYAAVPVRAVQTAVRADQPLTAEQKSLICRDGAVVPMKPGF